MTEKINLPNVTLCAVSSIKLPETISALKKSMRGIEYGAVLLFTHENIVPEYPIQIIQTPKLGYNDYSRFVLYELARHIKTDFALLVQYDGYVIRPKKWDNEFLNYDYMGAPWPDGMFSWKENKNIRVGNGGFSLRSKRLLNILNELQLPFTDGGTGFFHEDGIICAYYRTELETAGIKFATVEVAAQFSHELDCKESVYRPFGFHGSRMVLPRIFWPVKKILRAFNIKL